ncbi:Cytochrome c [Roseovarius litorisediminis]|uniref:Cytochrome c n=1 Tax=Roseovarius litorisediminis TaxID=1312363 RepID=A0A1Y5T0K4_9RHOB|nr:cytochrome c [Roseovarius litorisediminis]SLN53150.1 Cytochrome c [Roseovarius litorisediminis]
MTRLILIAATAVGLAGPAVADETAGRETYERYCASCHGLEATGQGPMRPVLTVQPADLTQLTAGNGGKFPLVRVIKRIDGRDPLVSHGSPMPVYGDFFEGSDVALKTEAGQPIMTSQPVVDLVEFLKSLQGE